MQLNLFDLFRGQNGSQQTKKAHRKPAKRRVSRGRQTVSENPITRLGQRVLQFTSVLTRSELHDPSHLPGSHRQRLPQSDPFLYDIWTTLRQEFFPHRLDIDEYRVTWSRRNQKRTLASCNIELKKINVARELNHPKVHHWLAPLLYHEMCHAYLEKNVSRRNGKFAWHGKEFRALEALHPQMKAFDRWVKEGGWESAVRSHRARCAHARRRLQHSEESFQQ